MTTKNKSHSHSFLSRIRNQRGQGLIEYLVIVALMGVATIAIVRVMGETVASRFASVTQALQGEKFSKKTEVEPSTYKKKDLGNFFDGVEGTKGKEQ
jgi:Flp pilus assembly pilin Flp